MDPALATIFAAGFTSLAAVAVAFIGATTTKSKDRVFFEIEKLGLESEIKRLRSLVKRLGGDPNEE